MSDGPAPGGTVEPELSPDVARRRRGLRTGWTTGTCASAAAKAALIGLVEGQVPETVEVALPSGQRVVFAVADGDAEAGRRGRAVVVKDAGDDPDCTDGARMTAEVVPLLGEPGATELRAGPGVGTVTLPGLGIEVGGPSITAVPRRMILAALGEVSGGPVAVTLSVPGGEAMARKTSNERLGIVGGISILGTTGIVRPFSTAAYRASVVQQVDVAAAQGERTMVLCTGSRSERAAMALHPELPPVCFVEVGDFCGIALRRCAGAGITSVVVVAMVGKIAKLAAGVMMTHFHRSKVDTAVLAEVAGEAGAPETVVAAATATATARHFFEACLGAGATEPLALLCRRARARCEEHAGGSLPCQVVMVDFEGSEVLARA